MKRLIVVLLAAFAWPAFAGTVRISGASVMADLNRRLAAAFMARHPGVKVIVSVSNCEKGLGDLAEGRAEIASTVRPINVAEIMRMRNVRLTIVGKDGLTIYVHPSNPVQTLTIAQLRDIYTGVIADWQTLGGAPGPIHVIRREEGSGCQVLLRQRVVKNGLIAAWKETHTAESMLESVAADRQAIGFAQARHGDDVKPLALIAGSSATAIAPTSESVNSGTYPLARALCYYTGPSANADTNSYLQFVASPEARKIVTDAGFFLTK